MRDSLIHLTLVVVFGALISNAAQAVDVSAVINVAESDTTNPITFDGEGNPQLDIVQGDTIAVDLIVDNTDQDLITAMFLTLLYDTTQLSFLGGGFSNILESMCTGFGCVPPVLSPGIPSPIQKPLSPFGQGTGTDDWIQALAHTNTAGTTGAGPDSAVLLGFEAASSLGMAEVSLTPFIEPNSDVIAGASGGPFAGVINLNEVIVNVPEPTSLALGLASTMSVFVLAYRRRVQIEV